tara:strand:+ start:661 stop:816 length:156 start_codon:yes stop_codon:yes gene_type:complete
MEVGDRVEFRFAGTERRGKITELYKDQEGKKATVKSEGFFLPVDVKDLTKI